MTFFAVLLEEKLRDLFSERLQTWWRDHPRLAWVHPDDLHLTLRFLGGMTRVEALRLGEKMPRASSLPSFDVPLSAGLVFDKGRHGGVLSAMPAVDIPELQGLRSEVEASLEEIGFARDQQTFRPHVTLARFSLEDKAIIQDFCAAEAGADWGLLRVDQFRLMKRREKKDNPKGEAPYPAEADYESLARFALLD